MLNYDTPEYFQVNPIDEEKYNIEKKYKKIISTLDKIDSKLENTDNILKEIKLQIETETFIFDEYHTMEWDYYDINEMETKKIK